MKRDRLRIHISNISEDVWDFISTISNQKARKFEIDENAELSDRDIFAFADEDNVRLVFPVQLEPHFYDYFLDVFPKKDFQVYVPMKHTGEICTDIITDKKLFSKITSEIVTYKTIHLTSYSASAQLYDLYDRLSAVHPNVILSEAPEKDYSWTVNFFGSKTGIRQLADHGQTPDFPTVCGYCVSGISLASSMASAVYDKDGAVVVKTNKGHAGAGVLLFRPRELSKNFAERTKEIKQKLQEDAYWEKFPILVEQYVECDPSVGGGFPNAEFFVDKKGNVQLLYYCGMRVTKGGTFKGVEIHSECLQPKIRAAVIDAGEAIGKGLASYGYCGFYDVDCLADYKGNIFVSESNVRRTGGTHVYFTAHALFGKTYLSDAYALSNNSYTIPGKKKYTFASLKETLSSVLFSKEKKEGVLIIATNPLFRGVYSYMNFSKTKIRV